MTMTAVPLIAGVTLSAVYKDFAVAPPYPPASSTPAVLGTDYSVDGAGVITVLRSFPSGGWMLFSFSDAGATLAGTPEWPAINSQLTVDLTAVSGSSPRDGSWRLNATGHTQFQNAGTTHTYGPPTSGFVFDGTHFDIGVGSDGSFSSLSPTGAKLKLEMDVTISVADFWTDNVGCFEDSGVLTKPPARVLVPAVDGQSFIPASFDCYPPPPPPPPIVPPPPPGGGNGSGPPHGDCYSAPVYEYLTLCHGYPEGDPLGMPPCLPTQVLVGYVQVCP